MNTRDFLATLPPFSMRLGLERMTAACRALGDPQGAFPAVLVAGTNGKGSTCAFAHAALLERFPEAGLYTSPHLVDFRERIRLGRRVVEWHELDRGLEELLDVYPAARDPSHAESLSYFEVATALAFVVFARARVPAVVLEVGLGGRLDATNVPGTRLVATAVTRIGLDHTEWLGPTHAAIAGEKVAIARPGVPMVSAPQVPAAAEVIAAHCRAVGAPLVNVRVDPVNDEGTSGATLRGRSYRGPSWALDHVSLGLRGPHQRENAAVAVALLEASGLVAPEHARAGLAAARWPGRLEVIREAPLLLLDGAHNPDGAATLARAFAAEWPGVRPALVFAAMGDKDLGGLLDALLPLATEVHVCAPPVSRALPPEVLAARVRERGGTAIAHATVAEALAAVADRPALVCGSLYLVGEARRLLLGDEPA